jgi:hypothetical protein
VEFDHNEGLANLISTEGGKINCPSVTLLHIF